MNSRSKINQKPLNTLISNSVITYSTADNIRFPTKAAKSSKRCDFCLYHISFTCHKLDLLKRHYRAADVSGKEREILRYIRYGLYTFTCEHEPQIPGLWKTTDRILLEKKKNSINFLQKHNVPCSWRQVNRLCQASGKRDWT